MKKALSARTLLLISALSYFATNIFFSVGYEIVGGALNLLGLIALVMGVIAYNRENKAKKSI